MDHEKRIDILREMALSKSHLHYVKTKLLSATDEGKQEHTITDRARDFEKYLQESEPFIQDWELIIGGYSLCLSPQSTLNPGIADRIHNTPNYAMVLNMGFGGICRKAQKLLETTIDNDKREYYESVEISYSAASDFVRRYIALANEMAEKESDYQRKIELSKISEVCSNITTEPANSFWDALQLLWFSALLIGIDKYSTGKGPIGRLDQFLFPFYQRDIQNGSLKKEQAQELLECLWIKFNMRSIQDGLVVYDNGNNIMLGGQTSDGKDATNKLTYMCLNSTANVRLVEPKVNVRFHDGTEMKLLEKACRVIKLGMGMPCLYNDRNAIPALINTGIPLEDAREYTNDGCTELYIPGKSDLSFYVCPMLQEFHNFLFG
ncbi:MAG: hypothetical protein QG588_1799, partial [Candidatus Poribacteria bacterium]|nr:hypothetical protein [Candidatus Poribacteria bacterium]